MSDPKPITGPVVLPADPRAVAHHAVHELAPLGTMRKPPTEREFEHAALDVALDGGPEENVYAVLAHLDGAALQRISFAVSYLESAVTMAMRDRGIGQPRG